MELLQSHTFDLVTGLSVLTVIGLVIATILILCLLIEILQKRSVASVSWCARYAMPLMLCVAMTATLGSLFFSEIAGWNPCKLCWYQRIFMYPQVLLLLIALWKKDKNIAVYVLALSLLGMLVSAHHYSEQLALAMQPVPDASLIPCDASGVSCAKTEIRFTFGFITLPMMAFTAFVLNALGAASMLRRKTRKAS
ncbi:MAG: disulfide bond formation protein B [Candidatus Peribacteraceae bacterium]|nr:disulfide bond formation protein B [Candidatus Peribacteraceae bacterium]